MEAFDDIESSPPGEKIEDKLFEYSGDHEESHLGIMSDGFIGEQDMEEIKAQELVLQRAKVNMFPVHIHVMAMVAIDDLVTHKRPIDSAERENWKHAMEEVLSFIEDSNRWKQAKLPSD